MKSTKSKITLIKKFIKEKEWVKNLVNRLMFLIIFIWIVFSATKGGIYIISFTSVIGAPVGIASASFSIVFSLIIGIINKLLHMRRNKKRKHNKIFMLARSKLNSIETLVSQALIDIEISQKIVMKKMN